MFDFLKVPADQSKLYEIIGDSIVRLSNNVTELTAMIGDVVVAIKDLQARVAQTEKCILVLHERLKQLEPSEGGGGNGFPSFKI